VKKIDFDSLYQTIGLRFLFLLMTIDLINVFCRPWNIGIDPIDVFLTISAHLCCPGMMRNGIFSFFAKNEYRFLLVAIIVRLLQ
jgi:hypothetical protein